MAKSTKSCPPVKSMKKKVGSKLRRVIKQTSRSEKKTNPKLPSGAFSLYVSRVLRHIHPGFSISSEAKSMVNSTLQKICQNLAEKSQHLIRYRQKKTLTSRELQSAVRLLIPGKLGKHADFEGTKALGSYTTGVKLSA